MRDLPYDEPAHPPRRTSAQPRRNRLRALLWGMGLTLLLVGLAGVDFGDHQRFALKWAVGVCLVMGVAAMVFGIFPLARG